MQKMFLHLNSLKTLPKLVNVNRSHEVGVWPQTPQCIWQLIDHVCSRKKHHTSFYGPHRWRRCPEGLPVGEKKEHKAQLASLKPILFSAMKHITRQGHNLLLGMQVHLDTLKHIQNLIFGWWDCPLWVRQTFWGVHINRLVLYQIKNRRTNVIQPCTTLTQY